MLLPVGLFTGLTRLRVLFVHVLLSSPSNAVCQCTDRHRDLSHNQITQIADGEFVDLTALIFLLVIAFSVVLMIHSDMSNNGLSTIPGAVFASLRALQTL